MTLIKWLRVRPAHLGVRTPQCLRQVHVTGHGVQRPLGPGPRLRHGAPSTRFLSTETGAPVEEQKATGTKAEDVEAELQVYKETRFQKLERMLNGEDQMFKTMFPRLEHRAPVMTVADFLHEYRDYKPADPDPKVVTLYGRIHSKRHHGTFLLFLDMVNQFQKIQAVINWKGIQGNSKVTKKQFQLFLKFLERGDHISITGKATRSSTNQLTIAATSLPELLAPAFEPLPERLMDQEARIQRRHHDLLINPEVADTLRLRSAVLAYLRQFFDERGFLEFQTPIMSDRAGGAVARPFITSSTEVPGKELALRIAPELWLKRLVVGGVHRVFEIGPAFRNEGIDGTHNPEFTICEFYSAYNNLADLIYETETMICGLAQRCQDLISTSLQSLPPLDIKMFAPPFQYVEFVPALQKAMGITLPNLSGENALPDLIASLKLANIQIPGGTPSTLPKLLDQLATTYLEPLSFKSPLFIMLHPACMSPLSKSFTCLKTGQMVSARAELFIQGRELANMYEEENNPDEQLRKMIEYRNVSIHARERSTVDDNIKDTYEDTDLRKWLDPARNPRELRSEAGSRGSARGVQDGVEEDEDVPPPVDLSYIRALRAGLPPTGGWGCGIERLVMLFSGAKRISDCLSFGTLRNVVSLNANESMPPLEARGGQGRDNVAKESEGSRDRIDGLTKRLTVGKDPYEE